jgi:hypothetical protein|tara:strand:+ start:293 stop:691 length:399 start_codon:yes stop_codon:yes gene_type:complete
MDELFMLGKAIRNQRLGEAVAIGIENGNIEEMFFIFDDDGYVTDTDRMAWVEIGDNWINEQGDTMQQAWGNGIQLIRDHGTVNYKFKGDIKIYGSEFGTSGIHEISTVSLKTEKPDTPDVDTIEEVNNPEQG